MFEFTDRTILCMKVLNDLNMREKNEKLKKYLSVKVQYFSIFSTVTKFFTISISCGVKWPRFEVKVDVT